MVNMSSLSGRAYNSSQFSQVMPTVLTGVLSTVEAMVVANGTVASVDGLPFIAKCVQLKG